MGKRSALSPKISARKIQDYLDDVIHRGILNYDQIYDEKGELAPA